MVQTERPPEAVEEPAARPSTSPASGRPLRRVGAIVTILAVVAGALLLVQLGAQQRGDPPHQDITLDGGLPLTLYVPGDVDRDFQALPDPAPVGQRPPVIVLAHGFGGDRALMSSLARSFAAAGYAVAAFDFRGHGTNANRFGEAGNDLRADLDRVVDWVETSPYVDPERLVVMGHSMGAGAVLDFATVDARPDVVVPISGGWNADGPETPKNVLFIIAKNDPSGIHDETAHLRERLAGWPGVHVSRTVVPNTDHATILWSGVAVERIVAWTDDAFGIERDAPASRADNRLGTTGLYLLCVLVLLRALGVGAGRLVPAAAPAPLRGAGGGFGLLVVALVVTMPLLAVVNPAGFLPLEVGDAQASQMFLAGALVLAAGAWATRAGASWLKPAWLGGDRTIRGDMRGVLPVAIGAFVAVYVLLAPFGAVYHRLTPSPTRLVVGAVMAVLIFPFWLAVERLTRRGSSAIACALGVGAKILLLVITMVGTGVGILPGVMQVLVPILAGLFVLIEVFANGVYASSRNIALIAATESIWLAWVAAATLPIRI
jgi:dienelactone hydrolase